MRWVTRVLNMHFLRYAVTSEVAIPGYSVMHNYNVVMIMHSYTVLPI